MLTKQAVAQAAALKPSAAMPRLVGGQRRVAVRAGEQQTTAVTSTPPSVDFTPNTQAASGYVEFDTAGQSNMYPVVTKAYEAGSDQDTTNQGGANLAVGVGAAAIAVGVLAVGLGALTQQGAGAPEATEQLKSLSEYASAFAAEL